MYRHCCTRAARSLLLALTISGLLELGNILFYQQLRLTSSLHPVEVLHREHVQDFQNKVRRQSRSLNEAALEYRRRYGRAPPPRFEKWYELARAADYALIDEFDEVMRSFQTLWRVPPALLRARQEHVWRQNISGFSFFRIKAGVVNATRDGQQSLDDTLLGRLQPYSQHGILPDMEFLVNHLDEPRVFANAEKDDDSSELEWYELGQTAVASVLQNACPLQHGHRASDLFVELKLITNITVAKDYCEDPELFQLHGFLQRPDTLNITRRLLPVLSSCAPLHFQDILLPGPAGPAYDEIGDVHIDEAFELHWEDKLDKLYWVGTSTGLYATTNDWRTGHRQRMALLFDVKQPSDKLFTFLSPPNWRPYRAPLSTLQRLFDLRISRIHQCEEPACSEMTAIFLHGDGNQPLEDIGMSLEHKYVLDIDGNTWSGRFHRLLRSRSCVFKMTIFRQAHDDRLEPWFHYVPVSMSARELPEIMRFFTQDARGREIASNIADAGHQAARRYIRATDADIATLRVLLELARLLDDGI